MTGWTRERLLPSRLVIWRHDPSGAVVIKSLHCPGIASRYFDPYVSHRTVREAKLAALGGASEWGLWDAVLGEESER